MECRSRPPENPQYYKDPATGKETDCWLICGGKKVPILCDRYCKGYCDPEQKDTSAAPTSASTLSQPDLNRAEIALIVIVVLLFTLLLCLVFLCLFKRFIPEKIRTLLRRNRPHMRNPEDGVRDEQEGNKKEGEKIDSGSSQKPGDNLSTNPGSGGAGHMYNGSMNKQHTDKVNPPSKKPQIINTRASEPIKNKDRANEKVVYKKQGKQISPPVTGSDTQTHTKAQHTAVSSHGRPSSVDTGLGSMSPADRDTDMTLPGPTESDAIVHNPSGNENNQEVVQYTTSESGQRVGHPSHSYTENNNIVTTPSEASEQTPMLSPQMYPSF